MSAELEIVAGVHAAFGDAVKAIHDRISDMEYRLQERYATLSGTGQTSTTAVTVVTLGAVPLGRVYDLRLMAFAPNPLTTNVTCDIFIHVGSPTLGVHPATFRDSAIGGTIPKTASYGRGGFPIRGGDYLYVVFDTTAAATPVWVTALLGDNEDR